MALLETCGGFATCLGVDDARLRSSSGLCSINPARHQACSQKCERGYRRLRNDREMRCKRSDCGTFCAPARRGQSCKIVTVVQRNQAAAAVVHIKRNGRWIIVWISNWHELKHKVTLRRCIIGCVRQGEAHDVMLTSVKRQAVEAEVYVHRSPSCRIRRRIDRKTWTQIKSAPHRLAAAKVSKQTARPGKNECPHVQTCNRSRS